VTASHLHFIADTREWDGTRVVFDLAESAGVTTVRMTHVGLRPGIACYDNCQAGWTFYIGTSLRALLNGGPGQPDGRRARNR
jgi:kynureninase